MQLKTGQIVKVRSRQYLVEEVAPKFSEDTDTLVRLSCLEDDALGESLEVLWEREIDAVAIGNNSWISSRSGASTILNSSQLTCTPCAGTALLQPNPSYFNLPTEQASKLKLTS